MNAKNVSHGILAAIAILTLAFVITGCQGVKASSPQPAPTVNSFTASSTTIAAGSSVTLTWATSNATSVSITNVSGTLATSGSTTVNPTATTTYTLTATGAGGTASMSVTVTVNPNAPTVSLTASPNPVRAGALLTLNWTTTNTTSSSTITFNPPIPLAEGTTSLPLPSGSDSFFAPPNATSPLQPTTVTYTATVTGTGGTSGTGSVTVNILPPLPTVTFNANPTAIVAGQSATLNWSVQNAASFSIDNGVGSQPVSSTGSATGSVMVSPATTTTYTATAVGGDGTPVTAQATVTVGFITLTANPQSVSPNGTTTLTWTSPQATSVTIDNGIGPVTPPAGGSITTPPLTATTTFTATATDPGGVAHSSAPVTVTVSTVAGLQSSIKHIIFLVQENRSFDNYFSQLGAYKATDPNCAGCSNDVNLDYDPNVVLPGLAGIPRSPFHERTARTHNLTPSWNESHSDLHTKTTSSGTQCTPLPNSNCKMDNFLKRTSSIPEGLSTDPNGDRAVGFYDNTDLPYYYELAAQFATSDSWFSPLLANTIANREYLFSGTSQGDVFPPTTNIPCTPTTPPANCQFTWPTIFDAMDKTTDVSTGKPVSWKYYYLDSSIFLAQWTTWQNLSDEGNVRCIDEWFNILGSPNADQLLPDVVFIERGGAGVLSNNCANTATGVDEHPDNNIWNGAAETQKIINALMNSPAWKDSIFILTYDEGGGVYDHVPPFNEVPPDAIAPKLRNSTDAKGQFNQSGFRVPLIVISPWTKPHFVSHVNRDNTAILKLIETRFGVPALTARDAAQDDMTEFFDFSNPNSPPSLTGPGGMNWTQELPAQPTCPLHSSPCDDMTLETHP